MAFISDDSAGAEREEIREISRRERIDVEKLQRGVLAGRIVIPRNPVHNPKPTGIGEGLRTKINVNIGTSAGYSSAGEETEKAKVALRYGADAIMDLSTGGDLRAIRKAILAAVDAPLGTVPIYQAAVEAVNAHGAVVDMTEDDIFNTIEMQAKEGVDFITVHCGVNKESIEKLRAQGRVADVVSRGGAFLTAWIIHNGKENPLYSNYDYLLELARKYNVTLSLGDGFRPGCIADASDKPQIQELIILGELVERARAAHVQAMVEGPGHVPLNQIEANVRMQKTLCNRAPFYVLGPLVTDIAPGYDHITAAIGGAMAAYYGADFLCYVTPSEHLSLPDVNDVREGTIASKIAAHAADVAKGLDWGLDLAMAKARKDLDWEKQFECAIDAEKARHYRERRQPTTDNDVCSMCGEYCAIKMVRDYLKDRKQS